MHGFECDTRARHGLVADLERGDVARRLRHDPAAVIEGTGDLVAQVAVARDGRGEARVERAAVVVQAQLQAFAARASSIAVFAVARRERVADDGIAPVEPVQGRVEFQAALQKGPAQAQLIVVVDGRLQVGDARLAIQLAHFGRRKTLADVRIHAARMTDGIGSAQLRAHMRKAARLVGRAVIDAAAGRQLVVVIVADGVRASAQHHARAGQRRKFPLREEGRVEDIRLVVAHALRIGRIGQRIAQIAARASIAHDGQIIADKGIVALVHVHAGDQARTQPREFLLVFHIQPQRIDMVVVDDALAQHARAAADGIRGKLPMVVLACKHGDGGRAIGRRRALPCQVHARGLVLAVGEGIEALAGMAAVVVLEQAARHGRIEIRVDDGGAQLRRGAERIVGAQRERILVAIAVLLPVVARTARTVMGKAQSQRPPCIAGGSIVAGEAAHVVAPHARACRRRGAGAGREEIDGAANGIAAVQRRGGALHHFHAAGARHVHFVERVVVEDTQRTDGNAVFQVLVDGIRADGLADAHAVLLVAQVVPVHAGDAVEDIAHGPGLVAFQRFGIDDADGLRRLGQPRLRARAGDDDGVDGVVGLVKLLRLRARISQGDGDGQHQ